MTRGSLHTSVEEKNMFISTIIRKVCVVHLIHLMWPLEQRKLLLSTSSAFLSSFLLVIIVISSSISLIVIITIIIMLTIIIFIINTTDVGSLKCNNITHRAECNSVWRGEQITIIKIIIDNRHYHHAGQYNGCR